ncbi:acyl-CoA-like ligand-binding transcription factor [Nonomuraea rhodomycinica]|uniref:acyl-CoA-like ligand-binding transcription factor n=1 Tax=Nonomuraea rhodomycinica TaxID=1712872 RepID=UPI0028A82CA3|nr:TetR family transcriptional regulator [Nonomuraea rhodomycinica]
MGSDDRERPGLRERKKRETRIALSWAAIQLTVERGWDNVRVEDIAAAAGVSPRTFNNYFSSKGEAIAARHVERAYAIAAELRAQPADKPLWEAVTDAALSQFALGLEARGETSDERTAGLKLMLAEPALQAEFAKAYMAAEAEFAEVVAERTGTDVTTDLYPRLVAGAIGVAISAVTQQRLHTPDVPIEQLIREAFGRLAAGLTAP